MKSTRFWLLLIGALLALSAAASIAVLRSRPGDAVALVYQDGECLYTIDLYQVDKPYTFTVQCEEGYNTVSVERGRICVESADCPDQVCVLQGWISQGIVPIACLPHRLVIRLSSPAGTPIDASAR